MRCRMFSSIPGLYPLGASRLFLVTIKEPKHLQLPNGQVRNGEQKSLQLRTIVVKQGKKFGYYSNCNRKLLKHLRQRVIGSELHCRKFMLALVERDESRGGED